jgi:hypothetical protein
LLTGLTGAAPPAIVARMEFAYFALYALGTGVVVSVIAIVPTLIIAWGKHPDSQGSVRYVSGETIIVPPEPEPERPRKRWRITIERV